MGSNLIEVRIGGKRVKVPASQINDQTIVVQGRWIRMATVLDDEWLEREPVEDPGRFIFELKNKKVKADLFAFSQRLPESEPKFKYHIEWDNVAAIPISTFQDWWENRLPQESRKNVRRAGKRGVTVKTMELNDQTIQGITDVYNADPIRQGIPNAHYGKDFSTIKEEVSTFSGRSEFLGAFYEGELIGFIKLVHMGKIASILHIVSKGHHQDRRPTNALLAKAVEVCSERKQSHLLYGKYTYGKKTDSSLTEFKRRNGFEKIPIPRYYIPLTNKGRLIIKLKLHLGLLGILPPRLISFLLKLRSEAYTLLRRKAHTAVKPSQTTNRDEHCTSEQTN